MDRRRNLPIKPVIRDEYVVPGESLMSIERGRRGAGSGGRAAVGPASRDEGALAPLALELADVPRLTSSPLVLQLLFAEADGQRVLLLVLALLPGVVRGLHDVRQGERPGAPFLLGQVLVRVVVGRAEEHLRIHFAYPKITLRQSDSDSGGNPDFSLRK